MTQPTTEKVKENLRKNLLLMLSTHNPKVIFEILREIAAGQVVIHEAAHRDITINDGTDHYGIARDWQQVQYWLTKTRNYSPEEF